MSKKSRRNRSVSVSRTPPVIPDYQTSSRDPFVIASARTAPGPALTLNQLITFARSVRPLLEIEDRRTWHPDKARPAAMMNRPRHRLVLHAPGAKRPRVPAKRYGTLPELRPRVSGVPHQVGFVGAQSVLICIRRKQRREALFGAGRAGKRAPRKLPRWNSFSKIVCRR